MHFDSEVRCRSKTYFVQRILRSGLSDKSCLKPSYLIHIYTSQVDKEWTNSVHSMPLPKWVFYHCSVHSFYTFSHHSQKVLRPSESRIWSVNKPGKSVKEVSHSSTLLYLECKTSASKWQTSGHFWSTWDVYWAGLASLHYMVSRFL